MSRKIAAYIQKDSPLYAQKIVKTLVDASRRLKQFPHRGRYVPEFASTHRESFVYSYRMIYRVDARQVLIVAVIHGKRLLESMERLKS